MVQSMRYDTREMTGNVGPKGQSGIIRPLAAMDLNSFRGFGNEGPNTPHHCQISVACQQIKTFDSKELFISELKRQEEEDLIV